MSHKFVFDYQITYEAEVDIDEVLNLFKKDIGIEKYNISYIYNLIYLYLDNDTNYLYDSGLKEVYNMDNPTIANINIEVIKAIIEDKYGRRKQHA